MSGNQVRLANGQSWTMQQFLDHFFRPSASGVPTPVEGPPEPVVVDRSWYMGEGPGRHYHPGMFPIVRDTINRRDLAPGAYNLWHLAPGNENDPSVKASISHYFTDPKSDDFKTRAFVFGNESARISGQVVVNRDGSKTFHNIEIRPYNTNFDFEHNTWNPVIEIPRELARREYDPENLGTKYDIKFPTQGRGRVYYPFTESQLNAAMHDPDKAPPGLLPSVAAAPPPNIDEHLQYLNQVGGGIPRAAPGTASTFASRFGSFANPDSADGNWIAVMAGMDPANPMQPAPQPADRLRGFVSNQPMPDWPFPPPIFNTR
jgi:hypothetical protein